MKCTLSGQNARIFGKAVQSLSKFGTDLFIEADQNGIQLRSVNANKSAVGTFKFDSSFFYNYDISEGSSEEENFCRLSLKACLRVFKSMKQVETCDIKIEPGSFKFCVQMNCRYETVKHFIVSIIDDENISADVPIDDTPNLIRGSSKIFSEITSHFQMAEEEITLVAQKDRLNVKNYVDGAVVNEKFMRSQLKLTADEFDDYKITEETSVTFCLREFKALLLFAESLYEKVDILFTDAGSPIIFQIKQPNIFEATLIMSTLSPDDVTMCENIQPREITGSFLSKSVQKPLPKRKTTKQATPKQSKRLNKTGSSLTTTQANSSATEDTQTFRFDLHSIDYPRNHASAASSEEMLIVPHTSANSNVMEPNPPAQSESEVFVTFVETEENVGEDEQIPQSPEHQSSIQRRGLRSIFSRCFEATYVPREPSPGSLVYVPDSDEDK